MVPQVSSSCLFPLFAAPNRAPELSFALSETPRWLSNSSFTAEVSIASRASGDATETSFRVSFDEEEEEDETAPAAKKPDYELICSSSPSDEERRYKNAGETTAKKKKRTREGEDRRRGNDDSRKAKIRAWGAAQSGKLAKDHYLDTRGDPDNLVYGSIYRMNVPRHKIYNREAPNFQLESLYRRKSRDSYLGSEHDLDVLHGKSKAAGRYCSSKYSAWERQKGFKRLKIVSNEKTSGAPPDFISLDDLKASSERDDSEAEIGESWEDEMIRRTREFNRKTRDSPHDSRVWIEFADFQVDAAALQYQNQRLIQLLEAQKRETHALEKNFTELKDKQDSYDETLIAVNKLWNRLFDDFILLGTLAGGDPVSLQALDEADASRGKTLACPPDQTFLCRLLQMENLDQDEQSTIVKNVQETLACRCSLTLGLMSRLDMAIDAQKIKFDSINFSAHAELSSEDVLIRLQKVDFLLKEETSNLQILIKFLHTKLEQYADEVQACADNHARDESEIKRLSDELEDAVAELEETRRKLVGLKMQKDEMYGISSPTCMSLNGSNSPEKQNMGLKDLKNSVEEAKILAASRLLELQEAQENSSNMLKLLEAVMDQVKDDKNVGQSKPYLALNEKLNIINAEIERCRELVDMLQADRNNLMMRDKELSTIEESADASKNAVTSSNAKMEEIKVQVHKCIVEKNEIEIKLEEAIQDSGRKDFKDEIHVMASTLSREMELMETQLNRCMDAAREAVSLRENAVYLKSLLKTKVSEHEALARTCAKQMLELKSLKEQIDNLEKKKEELQMILDMYSKECLENRTMTEIRESEQRAHVQAEMLKSALEEHSLELRVKAAKEAEFACQERLFIAEAEISDLKAKLDVSERELLELQESINVKDVEAAAYISEIETIGEAYEDMQTQNQHLQQQVVDRDDYNIKLVSESVKRRQAYSSLQSEKQAMAKQLDHVTSSIDFFQSKISHGEEQTTSLIAQAKKLSLENRQLSFDTEKARVELAETESELRWLNSMLEFSENELELNQQKIADLRADLENERKKGKMLKEEMERVTSLVEKMSPENEAAEIKKLQDEIKECKAILKCGVCFDRPKQVVITKCFHLFCSNCIQRNLEIRHRKCPACGTAFGQSDVKEVNI